MATPVDEVSLRERLLTAELISQRVATGNDARKMVKKILKIVDDTNKEDTRLLLKTVIKLTEKVEGIEKLLKGGKDAKEDAATNDPAEPQSGDTGPEEVVQQSEVKD